MPQEQFIAQKGIIVLNGKILLVKEAVSEEGTNPGLWDLPGGRLAFGEKPVDGLRREIREEVGLEVNVGPAIYLAEWRPKIENLQRQIIGVYLICRPITEHVKLSPDHAEYQWLTPVQAQALPLVTTLKEAIDAYLAYSQ